MNPDNGGADLSLRIVWSLARWVEDTKGKAALAQLAASAGMTAGDFDATTRWVSHAQMELFLEGAERLAGDEQTFRRALVHRFEESYGAFQHMVWALSHERMCQLAVNMSNKVITRISKFETLYSTRTTFGMRYTSTCPESARLCLSRKMAWSQTPRLRGLAPAELRETKCIARGDDCCEYHMRWVDERVLRSVLVGLAFGLVCAFLARLVEPSVLALVALPVVGVLLGYLRELRRIATVNIEQAITAGAELRTLGAAEAETRSEIVALQQRQHEWSSRMEQDAAERDATLDRVVSGLDVLQQSRVSSLRGFSHDLRNPLFVVKANGRLLRERIFEGENADILDDMDAATVQIEGMLGRLMEMASVDTASTKLAPAEVLVPPMVDTLRRRLRALVHGRGIDVSVVQSDDAPQSITVDRLVFDRIVDNLLTNAAKYTDCGSIEVSLRAPRPAERHGLDGLVIELRDTGRGIAKSRIAEIFRPRPAGAPRQKDSYGVGLSSAVRLLGQIGGSLEVTSEVGRGSTFCATFPEAPRSSRRRSELDEDLDGVIARVVTVRTSTGLVAP
ncbi:MAG: sensor histidine kinase [Labilithrix sp.]|nr:sensor histidine kinase [Labilithrix sp.]